MTAARWAATCGLDTEPTKVAVARHNDAYLRRLIGASSDEGDVANPTTMPDIMSTIDRLRRLAGKQKRTAEAGATVRRQRGRRRRRKSSISNGAATSGGHMRSSSLVIAVASIDDAATTCMLPRSVTVAPVASTREPNATSSILSNQPAVSTRTASATPVADHSLATTTRAVSLIVPRYRLRTHNLGRAICHRRPDSIAGGSRAGHPQLLRPRVVDSSHLYTPISASHAATSTKEEAELATRASAVPLRNVRADSTRKSTEARRHTRAGRREVDNIHLRNNADAVCAEKAIAEPLRVLADRRTAVPTTPRERTVVVGACNTFVSTLRNSPVMADHNTAELMHAVDLTEVAHSDSETILPFARVSPESICGTLQISSSKGNKLVSQTSRDILPVRSTVTAVRATSNNPALHASHIKMRVLSATLPSSTASVTNIFRTAEDIGIARESSKLHSGRTAVHRFIAAPTKIMPRAESCRNSLPLAKIAIPGKMTTLDASAAFGASTSLPLIPVLSLVGQALETAGSRGRQTKAAFLDSALPVFPRVGAVGALLSLHNSSVEADRDARDGRNRMRELSRARKLQQRAADELKRAQDDAQALLSLRSVAGAAGSLARAAIAYGTRRTPQQPHSAISSRTRVVSETSDKTIY